jgi:serine/threonine-protein kinase
MASTATGKGAEIFLGRYETVGAIGEGGMARVLLGQRLDGGESVVIKALHPHLAGDPRARQTLEREAHLLARFRHPNAIALHDFDLSADPPCLVLEHVRGLTLAELVQCHGRLDPGRAGRLLVLLCRVLQAMHDGGILHRDLTAANVMAVDPGGPAETVKVMDFGLARPIGGDGPYIALEKLAGSGLGGGTPDYICPEQLRGETADHRGDVYSLGALLYLLLTGRLPFQDAGATLDILRAHLDRDPPPFAAAGAVDVPRAVEAVVLGCLMKYPHERPQSAREVASRYEKALGVPLLGPEDAAPSPAPLVAAAPAPSTHPIDPHHLIDCLEAWMPEQMAVVKLRGVVHDLGGEVTESLPGLVRVHLPCPGDAEPERPRGLLAWLGLGKQPLARPAPAALMELHLQKALDNRQGHLQISVTIRPTGDASLAASPEWRPWCEQICRDLRAYLISGR